MTSQLPPTREAITAFARRCGLEKLTPEHLARMAELAIYVGELGRTLPRPPEKENAPAASFEVSMRDGGRR
jgi:hypothetical protein